MDADALLGGASRMEGGPTPAKNPRPEEGGLAASGDPEGPTPGPPLGSRAPDSGGEEKPRGEQEGRVEGAPEDAGGWGAGAAAATGAGSSRSADPPPHEGPPAGGGASSPETKEGARLSAENEALICAVKETLKEEMCAMKDEMKEEMREMKEEMREVKEQLSQLLRQKEEMGPQKQKPQGGLLGTFCSGSKEKTFPVKDFPIQFYASGNTGGCEKQFVKEVSKILSCQGISLKEKAFTKSSKDPLLLFCPIASRMGTDIENALKKVSGAQKILLVVMHFLAQDNPGASADSRWQGTHPALVLVMHTRYTLQDGFYRCEMNRLAVDGLAATLKGLTEHQWGGRRGDSQSSSVMPSCSGEGLGSHF